MSFASVSNPAPARGGPGVPSAPSRAVGGLPTVASLSNPNITASNPGTQVNMSVNVGIMCRPWSNDYQKDYREGDILFVHVGDDHSSGNLRRVANLPVLNECLKRIEQNVPAGAKLSNINNWRFFGVLVSVMDQSKQQRLFGVTVQGRASVINYWGDNLNSLDRLYLEYGTMKENSFSPNGGLNNNQAPRPHVLAATEEMRPIYALEVGFVGIRPHRMAVSQAHLQKCCQVQSLSNKLKRIEIFIRR